MVRRVEHHVRQPALEVRVVAELLEELGVVVEQLQHHAVERLVVLQPGVLLARVGLRVLVGLVLRDARRNVFGDDLANLVGVIPTNPVARIKLINADNRIEVKLDSDALTRLLRVLKTDENRTVCNIAMLLLSSGARLNEALSATHDQIDRQNRVWKIPASVSKSKRVRSVPLTDAAMDVLDQLGTTEGYLFVSPKTKEKISHVHKVWDRLRKEAGLPKLRIHDLRHSFASMLVNSGHSLYAVQQLLGHSSHSVTERYAHLSSRSLMDAANSASVAIRAAMPVAEGVKLAKPVKEPSEATHSTDPTPAVMGGEGEAVVTEVARAA